MTLNVSAAIRFPGETYAFSVQQAIAEMEICGETVTFDDAQVEGTYEALDDGSVIVEGKLSTVAHGSCARCLAPAHASVENTFRETFIRGGDPEDDEIFAYDGYLLDLERLVVSYVLLAMPMRFLCKEDCDGLAQWESPDNDVCFCQEEEELPTQRPFAALQQLLDEKSSH